MTGWVQIAYRQEGASDFFENMMAGKLHATVECNPLLASTVETVIEELEAGREVDKIYNTEENIYTYENAADYIDQRKY